MAILSKCLYCDKMASHSASSPPLCEDHDGRKAHREAEKKRWNALTIDEKLNELKARLDDHIENTYWNVNPLIG